MTVEKTSVKVIVVDPKARTVIEHDWKHVTEHHKLYEWIGTDILDHTSIMWLGDGRGVYAFVDDIGLHKPELVPWILLPLYVYPLKGNGVIIGGSRDGSTIDVPWTVDFVRLHVKWGPARKEKKGKAA